MTPITTMNPATPPDEDELRAGLTGDADGSFAAAMIAALMAASRHYRACAAPVLAAAFVTAADVIERRAGRVR